MGACIEYCNPQQGEYVLSHNTSYQAIEREESPVKVENLILKQKSVIGQIQKSFVDTKLAEVKRIIEKGEPWTDPEFPPQESSLWDPKHDTVNESQYRSYKWRRLSDIYENPQVFVDDVNPDDIFQGTLGDCYFLAVLASMAEIKGSIQKRFEIREVNKAGIYLITLYINGKITPVVIDDFVPCNRHGKPFAADTKTKELWAILLEKAWAKVHGTYSRIEAGLPSFACMHLLGTPAESLWHGDFDKPEDKARFWVKLVRCDKRQYQMMAASHGQGEEQTAKGIISGHAYSFIAVKQFEHNGQTVRLCVLRNPWGSNEWTGEWSDNSPLWTPQLREEQKCIAEDDGTFHIPFDDYLTQYAWTSIAVDNDKNYKRFSTDKLFQTNQEVAYFNLNLKEDANLEMFQLDFAISVCQQGDRLKHFKRRDNPWEPSRFSLALIDFQTGQLVATSNSDRFTSSLIWEQKVIAKGSYVVIIMPVWNEFANEDPEHKNIFMEVLCPTEIEINEIDEAQGLKIFENALKIQAINMPVEQRRPVKNVAGAYQIISLEASNMWCGYIYTNNDSQFKFQMNLNPTLGGLQVINHEMDNGRVSFRLKEREDEIVILKRDLGDCNFGLRTSVVNY